jgi:hypothetical protein
MGQASAVQAQHALVTWGKVLLRFQRKFCLRRRILPVNLLFVCEHRHYMVCMDL